MKTEKKIFLFVHISEMYRHIHNKFFEFIAFLFLYLYKK